MPQFVKHFVQDLTQDIKIRQCGTIVFNADDEANVITIDLYNGEEPATLTGSAVGAVICSDGSTVPVTGGTISGNTVTLTLTGDCGAIPGPIGVGVQIVNGTQKTTVLKAVYNVELFTTDNVVDPGSRITITVSDLVQDIADAVATIPADYTDLLAAVAPNYSGLTFPVKAGTLCWYNGALYQAKQDIATSESWTAAHWASAVLSTSVDGKIADVQEEVSSLKSAISDNNNNIIQSKDLKKEIDDISDAFDYEESKNLLDPSALSVGLLDTSTGEVNPASTGFGTSEFVEIGVDAVVSFGYNFTTLGTGRYCLYDASKERLSGGTISLTENATLRRHYMVLQTSGSAKYVKLCLAYTIWNNENIKPMIENNSTVTAYQEYFLPRPGQLDDAMLPSEAFDNENPRKLLSTALPDSVADDLSARDAARQEMLYLDTVKDYIIAVNPIKLTKITVTPPLTAGKIVQCGRNLFDQKQFLKNTSIVYENGYYSGMGSYFTNVVSLLELPPFKPYKNYIVSFTAYASTAMSFKFGWKYDDGTTRWQTSAAIGTTEQTVTFSSAPDAYLETGYGKTVTGIDFTYSASGRIYIKDFQIIESRTSMAYEAYSGTETAYTTTDPVELDAKPGTNYIYCTGGVCEVSYYRNRIGLLDGVNVVCLGDSITGNYAAPTDYPSFLHDYTGANAINCGFGGTRMSLHTETARQPFSFCSIADCIVSGDFSDMYADAQNKGIPNLYDHVWNLEHTDFSKVDKLVVFYGTNDFTAQVAIDDQSDPDDTSTYLGAFRYGVAKILSEYPNIRIYAVAPMYRYWPLLETDSDTRQYGGKYLYEFGEALIDCCKDLKLPSLDMYHISGVSAMTKDYYLEDGTHPTQAGRKNIGTIIGGMLMAT